MDVQTKIKCVNTGLNLESLFFCDNRVGTEVILRLLL